ncbi:MAG: glutamate--tRNA ligase [Alphaproteobacteria bacterium]
MTQKIITRFAPSPTGDLHIGGARTALFNYLFARHHNGEYKLRIENTDKERSSEAAIATILAGLNWLGINHDGEAILQSDNFDQHVEAAKHLVKKDLAYECYTTIEELHNLRTMQIEKKLPLKYDGRWRQRDENERKKMRLNGIKPTIRIKMPQQGEIKIQDMVQGDISVQNSELDDFILLRADGSPTYMLSAVVDDINMHISHIIRGSDHLTNSFRQYYLFRALLADDKNIPHFAHIPLILNEAGEKLSKRQGGAAISDYQKMGLLPEAMVNYLLRLGWSHGDDEIISIAQGIEWFDIKAIGKSPARTDTKKLDYLNRHYLSITPDDRLAKLADIDDIKMKKFIPLIKTRVNNLHQLKSTIAILAKIPSHPMANQTLASQLQNKKDLLKAIYEFLASQDNFTKQHLQDSIKAWGIKQNLKIKDVAPTIRLALSGLENSPSCFDMLATLGKDESLTRLQAAME